uniref:PDZ domain-containing protein n=1 Tax=Bracon brevicornis TaxID=1563983 RepID=A0A6V7MA53_9HYME
MKVTVCFDSVKVVVPCGDGTLLVRDLMHEAILRYRKATGKTSAEPGPAITSMSSLTGGGLLDPDDRLCDVADDREHIVAHFTNTTEPSLHIGGDGASSVGTNSPDFFQHHTDHVLHNRPTVPTSGIKRESVKRLSMHALSTRESPHLLTTYSALSLPRESRRREPLGQDAAKAHSDLLSQQAESIKEIVIKNEPGPLGLHVVPCYDLSGNDQGLRVEGIEPNGRIARDGQIDLHDKIIKINGHNLLRIPFPKVQEIFRTSMSESCLKISIVKNKKKINKSINNNNESNKTGLEKQSSLDERLPSEKSEHDECIKKLQCSSNYNLLKNANTRKIGKMMEIELIKGYEGLGFSVTTRDNPAGGLCPIYIKNILPRGAAVGDGRLRAGDRLLDVNKVEMTGKTQAEVVSFLRSIPPGGKVRMTISRQEEMSNNIVTEISPDDSNPIKSSSSSIKKEAISKQHTSGSVPSPPASKPQKEESSSPVTVNRTNYSQQSDEVILSPQKDRMILALDIPVHDSEKAGLGVSVKGKTSSADENQVDLGIFIKSVLHGGAASRDGRLRTNDQLLNINGVSLVGLSNSEAMETLRRAMLNTNSSVTGVITLTVARRIPLPSYDNCDGNCKIETANSIYVSDESSSKTPSDILRKNDNLNNDHRHEDIIIEDSDGLFPSASSPWNPVIDRLTEQYNKNSLRNESYCLATNKTWIQDSGGGNTKKNIFTDQDLRLLEESGENTELSVNNKKPIGDSIDKDSHYDSQLSLEEFNSAKFSRDALGRQSMSEKRHAALDAKNTDTYKRNKKIREGREKQETSSSTTTSGQTIGHQDNDGKSVIAESSFEAARKKFEKFDGKLNAESKNDYVYTIPGCNNKYISPKKHWLVDDDGSGGGGGVVVGNTDLSNGQFNREETQGFSNSRGDVKQASLNSALDERYKRSRKKGGIRSMLRLGKNRKSLNFGDNIEGRHETSNYCSGTINYIA